MCIIVGLGVRVGCKYMYVWICIVGMCGVWCGNVWGIMMYGLVWVCVEIWCGNVCVCVEIFCDVGFGVGHNVCMCEDMVRVCVENGVGMCEVCVGYVLGTV